MHPDSQSDQASDEQALAARLRSLDRRNAKYRASREAEARLLILIDNFSRTKQGTPRMLEGRVKLAKLDFLLRYPRHLEQILINRKAPIKVLNDLREKSTDFAPLDERMVRYRYGPWDPAYYALLGSLIGRGLVEVLPTSASNGFGYRTTPQGETLAAQLAADDIFTSIAFRASVLRSRLDLTGSALKGIVYTLSDVSDANWHEEL